MLQASATQQAPRPVPRVPLGIGICLGTIVLLTIALTLNLLPRAYEVHVGDVAQYSIRAPRKASYVSQIRTRQAREQAVAQVQPVVELDYDHIAQQRRALADLLQAIASQRSVSSLSPDQRADQIRQVISPPLSDKTARLLATLSDTRWAQVVSESQRVLGDLMLRERINSQDVSEVRQTIPLAVSYTVPELDRTAIVELVSRFVDPNLVVNENATEKARRAAQEGIAPVVQIYERGQTIVRDGQVIGPLELEALEAQGLRNPELDWRSVAGAALFAAALVVILAAYVWHFDRSLLARDRRMLLLAALLVITAVAAKMVIPTRPLWVYVFPLPAAAMLVAMLFEARLAIVVGVVLSLLVAWVSGSPLEVAAIGIAGTMAGALAVWRRERFHSYFFAAGYAAVAQIMVFLAFFLAARSDDPTLVPVVLFELLVNGVLSALLAVGSVTLVGRMVGVVTTMQLLELANPTQPLLRRLLMEAPGTYHHSIMVGNLAERAADVIGADSLLVRVAAYYHDVGKLERPWVFIENQADIGENIHESLDPAESAQIIAAHVQDGVKLAEKAKLPRRIVEMIPQHHGTRSVSFFYQQAAEQTEAVVDPDVFRYPGPRPQSREAAILMLADSTEAAARASKDHSREAIERLVDRIVRQRLDEGEFDDCNLTLRDLTAIRESFVTLLTGIYHARIPYPPSPKPAIEAADERPRELASDIVS